MLDAADGSAKWVQDGSAVLAAVHGPTQAGARREDAERAVVQVLFRPRSGLPGAAEQEAEAALTTLLEGVLLLGHHPRCLISVVVQVLQADGSLLAVALNAVCAALADAGVPMRCLFGVLGAPEPGSCGRELGVPRTRGRRHTQQTAALSLPAPCLRVPPPARAQRACASRLAPTAACCSTPTRRRRRPRAPS